MVGNTKFFRVGGEKTNILTKKAVPHTEDDPFYFATTFSFPRIPSSRVSTKGVTFIRSPVE